MAKIIIICPNCHKKLSFSEVPGFLDMLVECPICSYKAKASVYLSGRANESGKDNAGAATELVSSDSTKAVGRGRLRLISTGRVFELKPGRNIVGRRANTGTADIQIEGDMYMSRKHVQIDVMDDNCEYRLVEISSKNIIQLNHTPIKRNDIILLQPGDILTLGKTDVVFEIFEEEATQLI